MAKTQNNDYLDDLLDQLASRAHRRREQDRVPGNKGYRMIDETRKVENVG